MLTNLSKLIICSLGAISFSGNAMACDERDRETARPVYEVYEVAPARPHIVRFSTEVNYSCTVEYRQTTECRTTRYEERSYLPERPMRSIRYAYIDP